MSDFPGNLIPPIVLSTAQPRYSAAGMATAFTNPTQAAFTWPAANQAIYIPVACPFYYPVKRVFWVNGSTVSSAHVDFGIYNWSGTRVYSTGSTVQAGASAPQYVTPTTPFILSPGEYYFALACDSTTNHGFGYSAGVTTNEGRLCGMLQQATALPLPATATFAQWASTGYPIMGVTRRDRT